MGDTGKVRAIDDGLDVPRRRPSPEDSIAHDVAGFGANLLRASGRDVSPEQVEALEGLYKLLERRGRQAVEHYVASQPDHQPPRPGPNATVQRSSVMWALAGVLLFMLTVGVFSLVGLRLSDRVDQAEQRTGERLASFEDHLAENERERAKAEAELELQREAARKQRDENAQKIALLQARQNALVLHLIDGVGELLEAQGLEAPEPKGVLRLAHAEAKVAE